MTNDWDAGVLAGWRAAIEAIQDRLETAEDWQGIDVELNRMKFAALIAPAAADLAIAASIDEDAEPGPGSCPGSPFGLHRFMRVDGSTRCDGCGRPLHNDDPAA